ncbi:MAG: hypothetical protein EAZ12_06215 [Sphingobacteriia bacterium]|nr:MAG: hypothetical protein EAZ12_06215 [Sphingobacteriia bacterium]
MKFYIFNQSNINMKRILTFTLLLVISVTIAFGQTPIDITENTFKVSTLSEEVFYFGFAEGDQLIFNFEEINGKELKEVEIMALTSKSLYLDYKVKKIEKKILIIEETGVYKFRFTNSNILSGRVCKFKIQRIPANEKTRKFNTTVFKRTLYDTSYYSEQERFLVKSDTTTNEVFNQIVRVQPRENTSDNRRIINFSLPSNTVFWSYYIGVDQNGQQSFDAASRKLVSSASPLMTKLNSNSPLTALALDIPSFLSQVYNGEDIEYVLLEAPFLNLYTSGKTYGYLKYGKVVNDFARMLPVKGNVSFCFTNDNPSTSVSVTIKVQAIQVNSIYDTRTVKKMNITSKEDMYLKN